eukprot:jgi/Ulvmu1/1290/UM011_0014.1
MSATFEKSMQEFAVRVHALSLEWAKKLDAKIPGNATEAAANAVGSGVTRLTELMTTAVQYSSTLPEHFNKHYATADGLARKHVVPVVQPHYNRLARQLSTNIAPAKAWADQNVVPHYRQMESTFNDRTAHLSHAHIALLAVLACAIVYFVISRLVAWIMHVPEQTASQRRAQFIRSLPVIKGMVAKERGNAVATVKAEIASREVAGVSPLMELPLAGIDADHVMSELEERAANDFRYADGESKTTGTIYMVGDTHRELLNDAYCMFSQANPLHIDLFPSVRRMEAEVVAMTAALLGGGHEGVKEVCGTMTSGGSESNIAAVLASIAYARETRGVTEPEIIIAETAHASFWKAAKYTRAKLIVLPVDKKTLRLTAGAVTSRCTSRTALVVASAPTFPHGVIDDIPGIAKAAARARACMHVDCCLGAFVLPFMRRLRLEVPPFDFAVPGVTSMSADTHKYGLAHKGTSVVLFRSRKLRSAQYTPVTDWSGGLYISPGLAGSKSGGLVATAWASMRHVGMQGFVDATKDSVTAASEFASAIKAIPELALCGEPRITTVAFKSIKSTVPIFKLQEMLLEAGWHFNTLQKPAALHFVFTPQHKATVPALVEDLAAIIATLRAMPAAERSKAGGRAKVYGLASSVSQQGLVAGLLSDYQDAVLDVE